MISNEKPKKTYEKLTFPMKNIRKPKENNDFQ